MWLRLIIQQLQVKLLYHDILLYDLKPNIITQEEKN
jgi:hypothetical protein